MKKLFVPKSLKQIDGLNRAELLHLLHRTKSKDSTARLRKKARDWCIARQNARAFIEEYWSSLDSR